MKQHDLEKYLWGAATLLRGLIDAGDYKQYIFPLLFLKRICDVYEEEYESALKESGGDLEYASFTVPYKNSLYRLSARIIIPVVLLHPVRRISDSHKNSVMPEN